MSQLRYPYEVIDVRNDEGQDETPVSTASREPIPTNHRRALAVDARRYPPQSAQDQTYQRLSHSSDTSIALFALYLRLSEGHDRKKYELLKGEIDSILVFVSHCVEYHHATSTFTLKLQCGLFSATVAALIMPSIQVPDPSVTVADGPPLDGADAARSRFLTRVYLLWLCSLIISIFCALHALLLLRLVKPRTWVSSPRYSQPEEARMGVYLATRIERADKAVRDLHFIIISSLLVFFAGLLLYFFYVNPDFFIASLSLILAHPWSYIFHITRISPWQGSPRCTPFTQERIQEKGSRSDGEVLKRTLDLSRSDDDLEEFLEAIPGFCASEIVHNPQRSLNVLGLPRLAEALIGFWNRTLSSNRVPESIKVRRMMVCVKVIEAADLSVAVPHILRLFSGDLSEVPRLFKIGRLLRPLRNGNAAPLARGIIASIVSNAERNDRWSMLTMDELGISEDVLRDYLAHGDSVLLANLIHVTRHFFHSLLQHDPDLTRNSSSILPSISNFNILNTLPELQHDFCALWNEVVQQARNSPDDSPFMDILINLRHFYIDLHGTDIALRHFFASTTNHDDLFHQPASYPFCMVPDHHSKSTAHAQEASGSTTGG